MECGKCPISFICFTMPQNQMLCDRCVCCLRPVRLRFELEYYEKLYGWTAKGNFTRSLGAAVVAGGTPTSVGVGYTIATALDIKHIDSTSHYFNPEDLSGDDPTKGIPLTDFTPPCLKNSAVNNWITCPTCYNKMQLLGITPEIDKGSDTLGIAPKVAWYKCNDSMLDKLSGESNKEPLVISDVVNELQGGKHNKKRNLYEEIRFDKRFLYPDGEEGEE